MPDAVKMSVDRGHTVEVRVSTVYHGVGFCQLHRFISPDSLSPRE